MTKTFKAFSAAALSCGMMASPLLSAETLDAQHSKVAVEPNLVPLMEALIQARKLDIDVQASEDIATSLTKDNLLLGISSRKWQDDEVAKFTHLRGYKPTELFFTADVIAIIANQDNPAKAVTLAELKDVFGCNQQLNVTRWRDSQGTELGAMVPLAIDNQLKGHGTFAKWVACDNAEFSTTNFVIDKPALLSEISAQSDAIGYSVYTDDLNDQNLLNVINNFGESYDVNKETILSGRYPLASVYYMYLDLPPNREHFNQQEEYFISLTLSDEPKPTLNQFGFISLPPEAIQRNKVRLRLTESMIEGGYK
ncbi:substrate-binding domain-containing protein [Vibrio wakamikoensis]|uniref:PstS family phosphate ABC transporter substrate-binding protein n=1 Tax=Vibrio wakamikoensis TaxID=2910251 RepID=UPI003D1FC004